MWPAQLLIWSKAIWMDWDIHMHWGPNSQNKNWFRDRVGSRTYLGWPKCWWKWMNENGCDIREWTSIKVTNVLNECLLASQEGPLHEIWCRLNWFVRRSERLLWTLLQCACLMTGRIGWFRTVMLTLRWLLICRQHLWSCWSAQLFRSYLVTDSNEQNPYCEAGSCSATKIQCILWDKGLLPCSQYCNHWLPCSQYRNHWSLYCTRQIQFTSSHPVSLKIHFNTLGTGHLNC
jgi:hypothetical protein